MRGVIDQNIPVEKYGEENQCRMLSELVKTLLMISVFSQTSCVNVIMAEAFHIFITSLNPGE